MNKRGVTPIIAVILLMMMTVAAAGAAFFWIVRVQSSLTGGTEQHVDTVLSNIGSSAEFRDVAVNTDGTALTFNLRNTGSIPFDVNFNDTVLTLKYLNGTIICTTDWDNSPTGITAVSPFTTGDTVEVNSITSVTLTLGTSCDLPDLILKSGESVQYSNYFGSSAVAGGAFSKN